MFFFFPFNTDAPIYHYPIATIGLVLLNTLVFFATGAGEATDAALSLILHFDEINPLQWLTSNFMHADLGHLVGNMIFLWPYGLLVEGKLGWYRFIPIYLAIGMLYGAIVQCSMYLMGSAGAALGASAILYGLLALAVVWAPKNEFSCGYFWFLFVRFGAGVAQISVMTFGMLFVAKEILFFFLQGMSMSSEALHLAGFIAGFPLGVLLLKLGWVDCEGWDMFSVWSGKSGTLVDYHQMPKDAKVIRQEQEAVTGDRTSALKLLKEHLDAGRGKVAFAVFRKEAGEDGSGWEIPEAELLKLITVMQKEKMFSESVPLMVQALRRFPNCAVALRLRLAQIMVQAENRPRQALAVLAKLPSDLPPDANKRRAQIVALCKKEIEAGSLEMGTEDW